MTFRLYQRGILRPIFYKRLLSNIARRFGKSQRYRPEVWIEKSALVGVIEPACTRWRVPHFAARGYSSLLRPVQ